jgi:hypothetical protein
MDIPHDTPHDIPHDTPQGEYKKEYKPQRLYSFGILDATAKSVKNFESADLQSTVM